MTENFSQRDAMSMSELRELLKALIDKEVDNGEAIGKIRESIRQSGPESAVAALDQRIALFEDRIGKSVERLEGRIVEMDGLQNGMQDYIQFFKDPTIKEVHHRHFVGWAMWILWGLGLTVSLLTTELVRSWNREEQFEQNDILWRGAMQAEDSVVTNALNKLQREYRAGGEQFRKDVIAEEERRAELYQRWLELQQNQVKIRELENKKKKKQAADR